MGGGDLQATRTELDIHVFVFDDGDDAAHNRNNHLLALQPLVLRVVGVDAHGHVAHDGLGSGRSHNRVVAAGILVDNVAFPSDKIAGHAICHIVLHVVQLCVLLLIDHFLVGEGSEGLGIPVDHAHATIDEALAVEIDKHLDDAFRAHFIHREGGAVPVAGAAQLAQLLEDDASVLLGPRPGVLKELLACEVGLLDALLGQAIRCWRGRCQVPSMRFCPPCGHGARGYPGLSR